MIFGSRAAGRALALAVIVTGAATCRAKRPEAGDYFDRVAASRASKDARFKNTNNPLPESRKARFLPLAYYPVDQAYDVPAVLAAATERPLLMMPTSTGSQRQMRQVGRLEFTLKGEPMKLTAFVEAGAPDLNHLFVPFTDLTTGTETYPAGRYLDLDRGPAGGYEVDFNYAYHPYCYFNETLECPLPPAENRLNTPVHAGEKAQTVTLRGIVFDFDGVIANSEPLHFQGFREVLAKEGVTLTEREYYARYLGFDDAGAFESIGVDRGRQWPAEHVAALVGRKAILLEALERRQSVLFPGAAAAIARLAAAGPLAIASGALRNEITRILAHEDLARFFTVVVGAEDTPASKPAPDPYLRAVERLDATLNSGSNRAEYVAIEDSQWGLESAHAAGLRTVAVTHTYPAGSLTADLTVSSLDALTWGLLQDLVVRVSE